MIQGSHISSNLFALTGWTLRCSECLVTSLLYTSCTSSVTIPVATSQYNVSDPAFSFLVIRHLNRLPNEESSYKLRNIIDMPFRRLDQDQFFSFEKNLEWSEFDKILKRYLHNFRSLFQYALYIALRLVVYTHISILV